MKQLIAVVLISLTLVIAATLAQDTFAITKRDKKARDKIIDSIAKAVEGKWDNVKVLKLRKAGTSELITIYNTTKPKPGPPPIPPNIAPIAKIETSKLIANISDVIQLSANGSSDSDGRIVSYNWTGVNVTNSSAVETDFTFPNASKVLVSLTVMDDKNATASASVEINNWTKTVEPGPTPEPTNTTIVFTGDVEGTAVRDAILNQFPDLDLITVAGDLGYDSTLSWFKSEYGDVFGEELQCTIGNHDAAEDGSDKIYKEALAFCGNHWYQKIANGTTVVIGFNTNGKSADEVSYINSIVGDDATMNGVKNVILTSHKNGHVPPNSHHPAEASSIYNAVNNVPGVKFFEVSAHNHVMAAAPEDNLFISGAGGRSHYTCGTDSSWTFCNNKVYGFLVFTIDNSDGDIISSNFYNTKGDILN